MTRPWPLRWCLVWVALSTAGLRPAGLLQVAALHASATGRRSYKAAAARRAHGTKKKSGRDAANVYYAVDLLERLKSNVDQRQQQSAARFDSETDRLQAAADRAENATDKASLQAALAKVGDARKESEAATSEMLGFYYTIKAALGADGAPPPSCALMRCGENAACREANGVAACQCNKCFEGDGYVCIPGVCHPSEFLGASPLVNLKSGEVAPSMAEVSAAIVVQNHVVVAFRDSSKSDRGFLTIGHVDEKGVSWSDPQAFSGDDKAFGPVVTAHDNGRFLVGYRDEDVGGDGFLVGGRLTKLGTPGVQPAAAVNSPYAFAKKQAQRMVLVPLASSRAVCLYVGRLPVSSPAPAPASAVADESSEQAFGGVLLVQLLEGGVIGVLGKYRFAEGLGKISRLAATSMSPTSLVVAYRGLPLLNDDSAQQSRELSASHIAMLDEELVIGGHSFALEPDKQEMWSRSVALVSANLFAYSYHCGTDKVTKVAIVRVEPMSHSMTLVGEPHVIGRGDVDFLQAVSLNVGMLSPHTFTYLQHPGEKSTAEVCTVSPEGQLGPCAKAPWADAELRSVAAVKLQDGRLFFAYGKMEDGAPYYEIAGSEDFLQEDS